MTKVFYTDITKNNIDYNKYISLNRKEKIKNYKSEQQKQLSAFCEILLFDVLGEKVEILYDDFGKPYIKNSDLFINFSHSGNISVCAISDKPVGVDVEKIRTLNIKIAEKHFTDTELNKILNNEVEFIKYWTLKESYLKYLGTGLRRKINSFEISINDEIRVYDQNVLKNVNFKSHNIGDYIISTCFENIEYSIEYTEL